MDLPSTEEEYFQEAFPFYLSIGMSAEEYWERSPYLASDYYKAHMLRIEERNQELWLQGLYFNQAMSTSIANAFAKKGSQPHKYLEEPIRITPLTKREKAIKAAEERQKAINSLNAWMKSFNRS